MLCVLSKMIDTHMFLHYWFIKCKFQHWCDFTFIAAQFDPYLIARYHPIMPGEISKAILKYKEEKHCNICYKNVSNRGSPHGYWKRIHWIRIPDPDSMWACMSSTRHIDYAHCTAHALSRSTARADWIRIKAVWRQSGLWIRIPDLHQMRIQDPVWRAPLCTTK